MPHFSFNIYMDEVIIGENDGSGSSALIDFLLYKLEVIDMDV